MVSRNVAVRREASQKAFNLKRNKRKTVGLNLCEK